MVSVALRTVTGAVHQLKGLQSSQDVSCNPVCSLRLSGSCVWLSYHHCSCLVTLLARLGFSWQARLWPRRWHRHNARNLGECSQKSAVLCHCMQVEQLYQHASQALGMPVSRFKLVLRGSTIARAAAEDAAGSTTCSSSSSRPATKPAQRKQQWVTLADGGGWLTHVLSTAVRLISTYELQQASASVVIHLPYLPIRCTTPTETQTIYVLCQHQQLYRGAVQCVWRIKSSCEGACDL